MRQAVLDFLCAHGKIRSVAAPAHHWMGLAYTVSAKESGTRCLACDQPDREATLRLRVLGAGSRKIRLCPRCGLTEDRPAMMERIGLTIAEDRACLHLSPPRSAWTAALLYRPHVGNNICWPWPACEDNKPAPAMPVLNQDIAGGGQFLLFMLEGAALGIARAPFVPNLDRQG